MGTIAVTGSASGIGAACAQRFTAGGDRVIGVDQRDADVVVDLASPDGRQEAISGVQELCGDRLDGLVTCAGVAGAPDRPGSLLASVNYFGTVELMAGLRPLLAAGQGRAAVAISSNSTTCQPGLSATLIDACQAGDEARARAEADAVGSIAAYGATKVAVARWVRHAATSPEWAGAGIRLNAVAPGLTTTPMTDEGFADPVLRPMLEMFPIPLGRPGRPEEIAALVDFLLSADAGFCVGSLVFADGGTDALLRADDWPAVWDLDVEALGAAFGAEPPVS